MLAYMRSSSLEIRIAGCSCRPQLLLLLFAGIFLKNFYNPVLQARFLELGGGRRGGGGVLGVQVCAQATRYKPTLLTQKATNTGFVLNSIFSQKPFAILYLNATRAFTKVSWCETYI